MTRSGHVRLKVAGVYYVSNAEALEIASVGSATLSRWKRAGAVETHGSGRHHYYRLEDLEFLRDLSSAQTLQAGVRRTPESELSYARRWVRRMQDKTLPAADHRGEEWDMVEQLMAEEWEGRLEELALRLGRTYEGVAQRRYKSRKEAS